MRMSNPMVADTAPLTLSPPGEVNQVCDESNPDNGEWGWSALGSEDDGVDDASAVSGITVPSVRVPLQHDNSVSSVLSVDSTTIPAGNQHQGGPYNNHSSNQYKPRSPTSARRGYSSANSTPRGGSEFYGGKGITNSPSFNELEKAIGQTLALSISSSDSADGPSPVRNNSSSKLSATNLMQQKVQHQRMRHQQHENRRTSPYAQTTPRFFPTGPQSFTVMGMSVSSSIKSELGQFINESESRAMIIFHSPQITPVALRNACSKFGILYYIRPDFHARGVTFISYFDLRNALTAKTSLAEELGPDSEVSVHFSVTLHATNSNTDEFKLIVRDLPADNSVSSDDVESIFKRYGAIKTFERWLEPIPGTVSASSSVPYYGVNRDLSTTTIAETESVDSEKEELVAASGAPAADPNAVVSSTPDSVNPSVSPDNGRPTSYSIEYYNIQDARLAVSELSATTIPRWSAETTVKFAPLEDRKQVLCRQLLATISRWRNEMSVMYQQIQANTSPLASPMHGQRLVHSTSSSSIVSLGTATAAAFPPMMTPTGPYTTMFDRASPLTLDANGAMLLPSGGGNGGGMFYSNSEPNSANNLVAMMTAAGVMNGGSIPMVTTSNVLMGNVMIPSVMSNDQLMLHHHQQQQQHALQQAALQMQYMQNIHHVQQQYHSGSGGGAANLHQQQPQHQHGQGMSNSYGSRDGLSNMSTNFSHRNNDNKDNFNGYGGAKNQQNGGHHQQPHQQQQAQQQHVNPYAHQIQQQQQLQQNLNSVRPHQPFPPTIFGSGGNQSQQHQMQSHQQQTQQQQQHLHHPRPQNGSGYSTRTPSPIVSDDVHHNSHHSSPYEHSAHSQAGGVGGRTVPPHHNGNFSQPNKIPPHHHNGGHNTSFPPAYVHNNIPLHHQQQQHQQQQQQTMYGGMAPSYLQPRGPPNMSNRASQQQSHHLDPYPSQQHQQQPHHQQQRILPSYGYANNSLGSHPGAHNNNLNNGGGSGGAHNHPIDENFALDLGRIGQDKETRTTIMVRNIPNKYNQQMLLDEVNVNHEGTYDFFYLPIDFKNRCNVGYCFINFLEPHFIPPFVNEFNGQRWKSFNSEKVCAVSFARIQGKQAMIARFQNSSLLEKDDEYQPLLFYSHGPDKGKPEPFPSSNRQRHNSSGASMHVPPHYGDHSQQHHSQHQQQQQHDDSYGDVM